MARDPKRAGGREPDREDLRGEEDLRDEEELRVQRTEEELRASTREREASEVRVRKQVRTEHEQLRVTKRHEEVSVERVPDYRALNADERTWERAHRPKRCLLAKNSRLRNVVAKKLKEDWSPQQISGWLKRRYPDGEAMRVSHETIYRTLFVQARGALKRELLAHLRSRRMMRKGRHASTRGQPRGQIKEAVSIRERPPEAEDRAVPGHWEGDLLAGSRNTHVATLVERSSRFVMLVRVGGKDTESVVAALGEQVRRLPGAMMDTLTWDRGTEMAAHKKFTVATDVSVYFCDPKSPWQRGTSENTNRLLRQYLPRRTGLSVYDQTDLDLIALKLNTRPRKTLGYSTPAATLAKTVALTG